MGKKISWFTCVKRLFIPDSKPKAEKKSKGWKWLFGRLKFRRFPALEAPDQKTLIEATEEQRKRSLAVAIATAAAAEAAVAAANAAAEVVRMTNIHCQFERKNQNSAAIKIQSIYRGHLARKALNALKGLVKLQAVVRGELVRRGVVQKLRRISSLAKTQSKQHQMALPTLNQYHDHDQKKQSFSLKEVIKSEELKLECKSDRSRDLRLLSKEDMEDLWLKKQEAIAKRVRMKQYSFSHRERGQDPTLQELLAHGKSRRQSSQKEETEKWKNLPDLYTSAGDSNRLTLLKLRTAHKQELMDELNSPFSLPRRSFCHIKQRSIGDEGSLPNSPVVPTYMAATESAKAKSRSTSMPKQRLRLCDTYSGQHSPYKLRLSSWSSFNGETKNINQKCSISQ
ncbi:IQ-DOMAIN 14-like [Olea europaea subsp. europaea]|uniref:IQ-DOMAIN 14-like n=2 Tax=Olea europaea subsp. europaea TaxID=158383 RepID=A0A8S0QY61_OLEEU|nr:IQ-DOMAIN 14-like [Olea europaea subsp. europaea]